MNSILQAALAYAHLEWPVFPVRSGSKVPAITDWPSRATTDEPTLRKWFRDGYKGNLGIVTGQRSGVWALDVDPRAGGHISLEDLQDTHGQLPETAMQMTPSGGAHYLFRMPLDGTDVPNHTGIRPGIDVRGTGGCIIVAPSSVFVGGHPRGYSWEDSSKPWDVRPTEAPDWLLKLIRGSAGQKRMGKPPFSPPSIIPLHQRNVTLTRLAGKLRRGSLSEDELFAALLAVNKSRCSPPLEESEVRSIARSIAAYPTPVTKSQADPPAIAPVAFHGLAGEFANLIEPQTEADRAGLLVDFLVSFGNAIGRSAYFIADGSKHHANLYAVLVGDSSKARKGSTRAQVRRFFEMVDPDWSENHVTSGLSSGEGLIWAVKDAETPESASTVEDKRQLVVEEEFARVLRVSKRESNILSPVLRQAWDTGNLRTLTKSAPSKATDAHISIIAHITKYELRSHLGNIEMANGFGNRFLWCHVTRSKKLPEGGQKVGLGPLANKVASALKFAKTACEVRKDEEATRLWCERYGDLSEPLPGMTGAITSRSEAQAMRLALVFATLDSSPIIRKEHLEAALAVWAYCETSARFIFGDGQETGQADLILRKLEGAGPDGMTATQIRDALGRHSKRGEAPKLMADLEGRGLVTTDKEPTKGRSAKRYRLVPSVPETEATEPESQPDTDPPSLRSLRSPQVSNGSGSLPKAWIHTGLDLMKRFTGRLSREQNGSRP